MRVLGIDPGLSTGVVVREGNALRHAELVTAEHGLDDDYLDEVRSSVLDALGRHPVDLVAVEDVVDPNPHLGILAVRGLLATAQVLGYLRALLEDQRVVLVPPGGHGSAPLRTYPVELVGARERRGTGRLRHARSAWDIAGAGERQARTQSLWAGKAPASL